MAGFDALYKQTITLFNRVNLADGDIIWHPTIVAGVHLIVSRAATWNSYGGNAMDSVQLNISWKRGNGIIVAGKPYYEPKVYRELPAPQKAITFAFGNNDDFDFFVEGIVAESKNAHIDSDYERSGFYNFMNKKYDNVFAITSVSKRELIPHFEIMAR